MMKSIQKFGGYLLVLTLFFTVGCDEKIDSENLKVPRLMIESNIRGINYGSLGGSRVTLPISQTTLSISSTPLVSEFDIVGVDLVRVDLGMALLIKLSDKGARDLYRATVAESGSRIVFTINGQALGVRRITGPIQDGNLYTFVEIDDEELDQLVLDIRSTLVEISKQDRF